MSKTKSAADCSKGKKSKKSNKDKDVWLSVRIPQNEMKRLNRKADESGLDRSKYVRALLSGNNGSKQNLGLVNQCIATCQDILNIVLEKYSCEDNSLLEEKVKKLWKILSSSV